MVFLCPGFLLPFESGRMVENEKASIEGIGDGCGSRRHFADL
jgi:hypothetical protein